MALGKQYKLVLVPERAMCSCDGCWFYDGMATNCPIDACGNAICGVNNNWKLQPVHIPEDLDTSRYPFPANVNVLLRDLTNDPNTRQEIVDEVQSLRDLRDRTHSAHTAWEATVALHNLCYKYC